MTKPVHVKWMGPNDPYIKISRNDIRISLTKLELVALRKEIDEFIEYYAKDFTEDKINQQSTLDNIDEWNFD